MVLDLDYKSHPNKALEIHICGVKEKSRKYTPMPITAISSIFHDLGKINPNFQKKLLGITTGEYSKHSYISVLSFFDYIKNNEKEFYSIIDAHSQNDFRIKIIQIIAIIAHHHGNLPDFEFLLNSDETAMANDFMKKNIMPISEFLLKKIGFQHSLFKHDFQEKQFYTICRYIPAVHDKIWNDNALNYFMDTQFAFAALINADKRDAGNNNLYRFNETVESSNKEMDTSLANIFCKYDNAKSVSNLNKLRTNIRLEATKNIYEFLQKKTERIFTITAPTGAGKTFTLLSIAREIQREKGNYGIIYALPFLSITEQVQNILRNIGIDFLPITCKSENEKIESANNQYENNPTDENLDILLQEVFTENTFDHPFIVTTFVQFFETLISNNNSTLLKLPNFRKRIFLIDEVQALPPRLYIFFSAWLESFCRKNDSYAILSTATMPKFDFPQQDSFIPESKKPKQLFKDYLSHLPIELCSPDKYFAQDVFNRYKINLINDTDFDLLKLSEHIKAQSESCLIILNTIGDTKNLFSLLQGELNVILMNTHFIPTDRLEKILMANDKLSRGQKVIFISTQMIEAGVDIDFPIVYRDMCPLPSLIQSAGRCNRNKTREFGTVFFFQLKNKEGRPSSEIIYNKEAAEFLRFCKKEINDIIEEKDLFQIQSKFFDFIKENLSIGDFDYGYEQTANMIECINKAKFDTLGKFKLINKDRMGEQYQYYVPMDAEDNSYDELVELMKLSLSATNYADKSVQKTKIDMLLKKMASRMLTVRINKKKNQVAPCYSNEEEYFGIRVLADLNKYSTVTGLDLGTENLFI